MTRCTYITNELVGIEKSEWSWEMALVLLVFKFSNMYGIDCI